MLRFLFFYVDVSCLAIHSCCGVSAKEWISKFWLRMHVERRSRALNCGKLFDAIYDCARGTYHSKRWDEKLLNDLKSLKEIFEGLFER